MAQWRGFRPQFEVRGFVEDEAPVRDIGQRGEGIASDGAEPVGGCREPAVGRHDNEQEQGSREEPFCSTYPEVSERNRPGGVVFGQQERGDEVPREDEEGVDAEETAAHPRVVEVVEDDGDDGDASEAVERGLVGKPVTAGWRSAAHVESVVAAACCVDTQSAAGLVLRRAVAWPIRDGGGTGNDLHHRLRVGGCLSVLRRGSSYSAAGASHLYMTSASTYPSSG